MAVKIRLTRRGRKKKAMYDVIVADAKSSRDGRFIEKIGTYVPLTNPATIDIDEQKAVDWLLKGAQPTDTVKRILSYKGLMLKKHLQIGVMKGAITQEQADKKFEAWLSEKDAAVNKKVSTIAKKKADSAKERLEAERKKNEAKAEALKKKLAASEAVSTPTAEVPGDESASEVTETEEISTPVIENTVEPESEAVEAVEPVAEVNETPEASAEETTKEQ